MSSKLWWKNVIIFSCYQGRAIVWWIQALEDFERHQHSLLINYLSFVLFYLFPLCTLFHLGLLFLEVFLACTIRLYESIWSVRGTNSVMQVFYVPQWSFLPRLRFYVNAQNSDNVHVLLNSWFLYLIFKTFYYMCSAINCIENPDKI